MKHTATLSPFSDLPKILRLSGGLLLTMRLLKSRGSDGQSTGELLAMQRFFREFEGLEVKKGWTSKGLVLG